RGVAFNQRIGRPTPRRAYCGSRYLRLYVRDNPGAIEMGTRSQRKATRAHRRRAVARGMVRVEVQAPQQDAGLIRALAQSLRNGTPKAKQLRSALVDALATSDVKTAFDVFGSELGDDVFAGVLDQP